MQSRFVSLCALALAFVSAKAHAQQPMQRGYPNAERETVVAPGDTVRLLNRVVNEGGLAMRPPGRRLDLQYSTSIPANDSLARQAQADRAAQFFGPDAIEIGARRLSIGICDTRACAERRDPPGTWYMYERTARGWKRAP